MRRSDRNSETLHSIQPGVSASRRQGPVWKIGRPLLRPYYQKHSKACWLFGGGILVFGPGSRYKILDHVAKHVGQAELAALVAEGQTLVVDTQQV